MKRFVVIGGGAAGFFAAINAAERWPDLEVIILEGGRQVLQKVRISGGGRCNLTHACFDPRDLVSFYPRGQKELRGPFHRFMTGDTMAWFESRGVALKIEEDGRIFPASNRSQSIVDCLLDQADKAGVILQKSTRVNAVEKTENGFLLRTASESIPTDYLLVATGSNTAMWKAMEAIGHQVIPPVPSLFTFHITDERLAGLSGIAVPNASMRLGDNKLSSQGALLITHWGLSGPAVLKLSAWGARSLHAQAYQFSIVINWLSEPFESVLKTLQQTKQTQAKKQVGLRTVFTELPKRLYQRLLVAAGISEKDHWAQLSHRQLEALAVQLTQGVFRVQDKSTFKEEFVTAGGIALKEINFQRFESKIHKHLFFAGEVLDIDALTGGFNFQNAWTGGYIVADSLGT